MKATEQDEVGTLEGERSDEATVPTLARQLATGAAGAALFGAAVGAGHGGWAIAKGAWAAPALFAGGALMATPPLYLSSALCGGASTVATTATATMRSLERASMALAGLALPAVYLSTTMPTASAEVLLVTCASGVGAAAVVAVAARQISVERATAAQIAAAAWAVLALLLGARLMLALARACGALGGV